MFNRAYHLLHTLALKHPTSCVATHTMQPQLSPPLFSISPLRYLQYNIAKSARPFGRLPFGYHSSDFSANSLATRAASGTSIMSPSWVDPQSQYFKTFLRWPCLQPATLSYALCDSPTGLLSVVLSTLRSQSSHSLLPFTPTDLVTFTMLSWLPGPEGSMRYFSTVARELCDGAGNRYAKTPLGITVFLEDDIFAPPQWAAA